MVSKRHRPTSDKELQACSGGAGQSDQGKEDLIIRPGEHKSLEDGKEYGTVTVEKGAFVEF